MFDLFTDEDEERAKTKRINGIVSGIVTNNKDDEGLYRVKVKFPWLTKESEGDWAKVMSFMAGKERGGFFLPEVGDEVLVAFEHGDINYPYVIGSLWNSEDKPPETNSDGKNNIRKITSRSGHEIIFNDDDGAKKEKIEIHTNAGHKVVLDDSAGKEKIEIIDKTGNNLITIDSANDSIEITSNKDIKLSASNGKISLDAMEIEVKSSADTKIESGANADLKASGNTTLKGAMVMIN
ncbi:MAG: phage tail protein [Deltaproteobacteria bacterium]|nr:phage tail protein [Deltaproteobacteria bacterium]